MGRHRNMIIAPLNFPSRSLFRRPIHNNGGNVERGRAHKSRDAGQ